MTKGLISLLTVLALTFGYGQQGVTDTEILIGNWGPQSGPAAAWGAVTTAIDAYFRYVNDQGGINGRQLRLISRDDGYDPARTVAAVRELNDRERVFAFVGGVGTANGQAILPYIEREGIPWVSPASGSVIFAERSGGLIFATFTNYVVESALMTRYAAEELGVGNIAVFYQNDDYGREGLRGLEEEVERLRQAGLEVTIGDRISYERGSTNMAVQALRLSGSGADAVLMYSDPSAAAALLTEMGRLEFSPRILASTTLLDPSLLAQPGMQGALLSSFLRLPSVIVGEGNGDPTADRLFMEVIVPYAPQIAQDPFRALAGIAFAEPMVEALRAAGRELSRESFVEAMRGLDNYSEGMFYNLSFADSAQGNNAIFLLQMTPEGLRPVSDWIDF
ncbi:MAG: ABC transporter substrate-binding protein [Deinococcota bacterium]|nr:ABC transporter substrate-binding protein [Deinococcota bacterium]